MFANFYDKKCNCLFSVEIDTEKQGEKLADRVYQAYPKVADWTITEKAISNKIKTF